MKSLVSIFIPHAGNNYRPHLIKRHVLAVFALLLVAGQLFVNYSTTGTVKVLGYASDVTISELLSLTNQQRSASGLAGLQLHSQLNAAAQSKASHMIANNYWSHIAPDGTTPWYFIDAAGYAYDRAGENLAYGFSTSSGVISGWMNSPAHAANILDKTFKNVGFGIANGANFQGDKNTVIVAMYADPATLNSPQPSAAESQPDTSSNEAQSQATAKPEEPKKEEQRQDKTKDTSDQQSDTVTPLENTSQIEVSSRSATQVGSNTITVFEALITGQAHWFLYISLGALLMVGFVYLIRHLTGVFQIIINGEHFLEGHPLLEASIIYAVIWLVIISSYGVIL